MFLRCVLIFGIIEAIDEDHPVNATGNCNVPIADSNLESQPGRVHGSRAATAFAENGRAVRHKAGCRHNAKM